jgi:hypothetical protein
MDDAVNASECFIKCPGGGNVGDDGKRQSIGVCIVRLADLLGRQLGAYSPSDVIAFLRRAMRTRAATKPEALVTSRA